MGAQPAKVARLGLAKPPSQLAEAPIWWSNAIFFVTVHIAACVGAYYHPIWSTSIKTIALAVVLSQCGIFGITVGYHRLYSHQSFRASTVVRVASALCGASACQGSIKWWALRHRLHHRYTDDPIHDPYAATRGLLWSHMGWIFFKPKYDRMNLIDSKDLERDGVVTLQHNYYVPITLVVAFVLPPLAGNLWKDAIGAFIWAGLVKTLFVWHCTFMINSAAHWDGVQPYSDEDTSRTNLIIALFTGGEGNHNFHHSFPHDFRSGPTPYEWDPSKWIIMCFHYLGLAKGLKRARQTDLDEAQHHMITKQTLSDSDKSQDAPTYGLNVPSWTLAEARAYAAAKPGRCVLVVDDYVVDATAYLGEHPGGALLLRRYALHGTEYAHEDAVQSAPLWKQATSAFGGGLNNHSRAAKRQLGEQVVARIIDI